MARALTSRVFAMVTINNHHKQLSKASFKIRGEEGWFYSDSLNIEIAR
jgi:hypothetical protein